jgi:solute carrier family 25 S-adenosylmethionine transporter 26
LRVPVEVYKQRRQALLPDRERYNFKLLYRGYWSTVLRDMPFSLIQFPLWEYFKKIWSEYIQRNTYPIEGAICGAFAGSIAAAITTPLDVVKTRIMLFNKNSYDSSKLSILNVLFSIYKSNGVKG